MAESEIILQIDTDELGSQPDEIIGSLVKAVMFAAQNHPAETGILSWYTREHADLRFIPKAGNSMVSPRYEIDIDGILINRINVVSPYDYYTKEHLIRWRQ